MATPHYFVSFIELGDDEKLYPGSDVTTLHPFKYIFMNNKAAKAHLKTLTFYREISKMEFEMFIELKGH